MIAHLTSCIPAFGLGMLADRFTVWKMLLVAHFFVLAGSFAFMQSVPTEDHIYTRDNPAPVSMAIFWIINYNLFQSAYVLEHTMFDKSIVASTLSRGTFLGASAIIGSLASLLIDACGGHIYSVNKVYPFYLPMGTEVVVILLMLGLGCSRQLNI